MSTIVCIEKTGTVKQVKVQNVTKDILYKKCNFRSQNDFEKRTVWEETLDDTKYKIELWAKDNGKANTENKYDFPPPVDNELYFGTCCLIRVDDENDEKILNLTTIEWNKIYEKLFGGFEDIEDEEEDSEDELDNVPDEMKTASGYLKDDFVVDSDASISDEEYDEEHHEEDEEEEEFEDMEDETGSELEEEEYDEESIKLKQIIITIIIIKGCLKKKTKILPKAMTNLLIVMKKMRKCFKNLIKI